MYSVVAHQNYGRGERRPKPQNVSGGGTGGGGSGGGSGGGTVSGGGGSGDEASRRSRSHRPPPSFTARLLGFIKRRINPEPEEELDQFNIHVSRYRPEELTKLIKITKFTRKEIQLIYRGFKQECPTGMVDEDSFKHIFSQFFPQGDASQYAHYVFNTIKHNQGNQTGKISFEDFLLILSKVSRGSVQEKLQWVFGLYDLNGDGLITKKEMLEVVTSIYEMVGRSTQPQVEEHSAKEHVEKIFHLVNDSSYTIMPNVYNWLHKSCDNTSIIKAIDNVMVSFYSAPKSLQKLIPNTPFLRNLIDTNKDGVVTIDELVEWCSRDEQILQSLETLDTVL